jgi:hypothetical protein
MTYKFNITLPTDLLDRDSYNFYRLQVQLPDGELKSERLNLDQFRTITVNMAMGELILNHFHISIKIKFIRFQNILMLYRKLLTDSPALIHSAYLLQIRNSFSESPLISSIICFMPGNIIFRQTKSPLLWKYLWRPLKEHTKISPQKTEQPGI